MKKIYFRLENLAIRCKLDYPRGHYHYEGLGVFLMFFYIAMIGVLGFCIALGGPAFARLVETGW